MRKKLGTLSILITFILILGACGPRKETANLAGVNTGIAVPGGEAAGSLEGEADGLSGTDENAELAETSVATEETVSAEEPEEGGALVSYTPEIVTPGLTFTGNAPLDVVEFLVPDPMNEEELSTEQKNFGFGAAKDGLPSQLTVDNQTYFDGLQVNALAWDNQTEGKNLYLTFDCGYEYETLTSDMLDVLKEKKVSAAFFCTLDYLETAPQVVARMIEEGHIVGNHSSTHPSDSSALSREELAWEVLGVDNYLRANFGYTSPYFRFPAGVYSENALDLVRDVGFRNVFWSMAHADWDPKNQPGIQKSFQTVTGRLHPGAVILLHTTSPDNAAILGDFIDYAREQGYVFCTLDEYPWD